jgi:cell division protein FtsZ
MPGLINLDFADVRSVMQEMGKAMMGTGEASGDNRALEAAQKAIANPLLDGVSMQGAKGVIISITGGDDMRLLEVDEAANHIRDLVDPDANIIWGSAFNPDLEGRIRVSVVATGIEADVRPDVARPAAPEPTRSFSFAGARKAEETASFRPSAPAPTPAPVAAPAATQASEPEPVAAAELEPVAAIDAAPAQDEDELVLGADAMVEAPTSYEDAPAAPAPAADEGGARRRWLSPGSEAAPESTPAPRVKLGGTLFERMSNAARGAQREDAEPGDSAEPLDIPRFLHRQNNQ